MNELFKSFYEKEPYAEYQGFDIGEELDRYEKKNNLAINIIFYKGKNNAGEDECSIERFSKHDERKQIYLNLYENHLSYITDFAKLVMRYVCDNCANKFDHPGTLKKHLSDGCVREAVEKFPEHSYMYNPDRNLIVELCDYYETNNLPFTHPYMITFDMESILTKINDRRTDTLEFTTKHTAISFSIYSNVPGYDEEYFICTDDAEKLVKEMFQWFDKIHTKSKELMFEKFSGLLSKIPQKTNKEKVLSNLYKNSDTIEWLEEAIGLKDDNIIDCLSKIPNATDIHGVMDFLGALPDSSQKAAVIERVHDKYEALKRLREIPASNYQFEALK